MGRTDTPGQDVRLQQTPGAMSGRAGGPMSWSPSTRRGDDSEGSRVRQVGFSPRGEGRSKSREKIRMDHADGGWGRAEGKQHSWGCQT